MADVLERPPLTQLRLTARNSPRCAGPVPGRGPVGQRALGAGPGAEGRAAPPGSRSWPGSACSRLSCSSGFGTGTSGSCSGPRGPGCGWRARHWPLAGSSGWKRKNGEGGP